ncbi:acylphosphatase [Calidifontibacillus erzurumensis]|uniref:acylphosphatase n=1 Tax=Calidifontibacillus erzurumensis TaxID=2741433 RepID=UPI0035B50048
MKLNHSLSLPHLPKEVLKGARKTKLCAYAVALEGWRRGLKLTWYSKDSDKFDHMITFGTNPPGRLFSLSSDERTHYFFRTRGDKVTKEAVEIGSDKDETKLWLLKAGVSTPEGKKFEGHVTDDEIVQYSASLDFPLVLKPTNGSMGNGVITDIENEEELRKALHYVRVELGYDSVILERFATGEEYRVYVIEDQVIAAYNRKPANVTGDGVHTIEELVELKNKLRKKNARLYDCLIEISQETIDFIGKKGYTLQSIPKEGEVILLQEKTNVSAGGDPVDATDKLPQEIKQLAIDAVKAIPGLHHGGVDIIWDQNKPIDKAAVVIEINPTAQIGGALFPVKGKSRDIPAAIIDYYFPETKGIKTDKEKIYFDFKSVLEPLQNRTAIEVEVPRAPIGKIYTKRYLFTLRSVKKANYQKKLKKRALAKNLHGHVNLLSNSKMELVVAGTDKKAIADFKKQLMKDVEAGKIAKVQEKSWKKPVKVGFEISEDITVTSLQSAETKVKNLEKEIRNLEKQKNRLEFENIKLQQSNSWRYTAIIRKLGRWLKGKNQVLAKHSN